MEQEPGAGSAPISGPGESIGSGAGERPVPLARLKRPPLSPSVSNGAGTLIAALMWTAFACALFVPEITRIYEHERIAAAIAKDGRPVTGRVVSHSVQPGEDEPIFRVCYDYAVPVPGASSQPPREFEMCESQSGPELASLREGEPVSVRYSAAHPELVALTKGGRIKPLGLVAWVSPAFLALFILVGAGGTISAINGLRNRGRLERRGVLTSAVLFDRWEESSGESSDECVAYAFWAQPAEGAPVLITRAERNGAAYKALSVGQRSPVRYLAESPSICELADFL